MPSRPGATTRGPEVGYRSHVPGSGRLLPGLWQPGALPLQRRDLRLQGAQLASLRVHATRSAALQGKLRPTTLSGSLARRELQAARAHSRRGPFASSRGRGCMATCIRPTFNLRFRSWRPSEGGAWWLDTPDASGRWFLPNRTSSSSGRPPPQTAFERPESFRH